ncbi:MAG: DNA translocase FtsK, partial [Candidatus Coproplasma sp.]
EKPKHVWKKYVRPTLDLLEDYPENNNVNTGEIEESKQIICETLANFRIDSRIANVVVGPAITRYDVIIEDRTNIKNALKYRDAIAMALMKENVNAYLNYAKGAISIEVPNAKRTTVGLKGMLASSEFINAKPNSLTFTLGKNVDGQVVCPDITKMPHLLVAGTTGSGKSICLSTLIVSLLYKYGPEELRFILVDPKQVEFISYDKLPHLMINEIIYDVDKAMKALNWAIKEMERRYALFKEMTEKGIATKNLTEYNAHLPEGEEKLPKIVIILDEFGDLMLQAKKDIESRIIRLVQKARACGIHLILATQRPSVDCITGLIKSNLPTRIGFKVNSFDDSRCIFDIGGAEKLLGKGDLYFRSAENPDLARIQGCFIDTPEVQRVTDFIKANNETYFDESVSDFINRVEEEPVESAPSEESVLGDSAKVDDTFIKALWFCVTSNQASVSMIQRRFPIGYMKACKIIDWMENMNYITQSEGSKPRKVLLSKDEFIAKFGDVDD